jgi:single-stranded DNA-binding protein
MSVAVLVSGEIFRGPEVRTSKAGKDYYTATLRAADGTETTYWSLVAFADVATKLQRLHVGDMLAAQGRLKTETFEKNGQTRVSLSILANSILPLRQPRATKSKQARSATKPDNRGGAAADLPFDDRVPF